MLYKELLWFYLCGVWKTPFRYTGKNGPLPSKQTGPKCNYIYIIKYIFYILYINIEYLFGFPNPADKYFVINVHPVKNSYASPMHTQEKSNSQNFNLSGWCSRKLEGYLFKMDRRKILHKCKKPVGLVSTGHGRKRYEVILHTLIGH